MNAMQDVHLCILVNKNIKNKEYNNKKDNET